MKGRYWAWTIAKAVEEIMETSKKLVRPPLIKRAMNYLTSRFQ